MISILITIGTVLLILIALFLCLVILAQRTTGDGNMTAMGGGMVESTFGPDTSSVLSGLTIKSTIAFFVLSFLIYLGYVYRRAHPSGAKGALPNISAPASTSAMPALPAAPGAKSATPVPAKASAAASAAPAPASAAGPAAPAPTPAAAPTPAPVAPPAGKTPAGGAASK